MITLRRPGFPALQQQTYPSCAAARHAKFRNPTSRTEANDDRTYAWVLIHSVVHKNTRLLVR
jgi:hypothetical protein